LAQTAPNSECSIQYYESMIKIGLRLLRRLRSLSLAHNYLSDDVFDDCDVRYLFNLRKLDISRNLLSAVPVVICELTMYVTSNTRIVLIPISADWKCWCLLIITLQLYQKICLN